MQVRSIRAFGSAGINLAYLAMGAVDCYFEFGFHIWDYAGPCLLVRCFEQNDDVDGDNVVCFFLGLCWILSSRELSGTISNIDSICLFNIININDHQGGGRSGG